MTTLIQFDDIWVKQSYWKLILKKYSSSILIKANCGMYFCGEFDRDY